MGTQSQMLNEISNLYFENSQRKRCIDFCEQRLNEFAALNLGTDINRQIVKEAFSEWVALFGKTELHALMQVPKHLGEKQLKQWLEKAIQSEAYEVFDCKYSSKLNQTIELNKNSQWFELIKLDLLFVGPPTKQELETEIRISFEIMKGVQ